MNPDLDRLQSYPFEKLRQLFAGVTPDPGLKPISLGMGEPQHPAPQFVLQTLQEKLPLLSRYPATRGIGELREAIASWLQTRFGLATVDANFQVLPVNGTREALFAFAQAVVDRASNPLVICPNPFYQIYEGASLLSGAQLSFYNCCEETAFLPDFEAIPERDWQRCQLLFLCSPGNPTGAVIPLEVLSQLVQLAQRYDFVIASDECYSEIYSREDQPPPGLLQACEALGLHDYRRCVVFHSLSKRSNLPGLRSGFVAGDAAILEKFLLYRTYHGCAMPLQHQWASAAAWQDEAHVRENRTLYREKFDAVIDVLAGSLDLLRPDAGFYLWPRTPIADTDFSRRLYEQQHLTVLPGQFLARESSGGNPGENRVRLALVAPVDECREAATRLRQFCLNL